MNRNLDFNAEHCKLNTGHRHMSNIRDKLRTPNKTLGFSQVYIPNNYSISSTPTSQPPDGSRVMYHNSDPLRTGL